MKKLLLILIFFSLFFFSSCEKESNSINTCPDLIQNVNLEDFPMDHYGVNEIKLDGNELSVNVTYGGGCEDHIFNLVMEPNYWLGIPPVYYYFYLSHNANNDACYALIADHNLCFDISELVTGNLNNEVFLFFSHPDSLYKLN
tara:strand:+ start:121 stop:549 length:429 start_codon:yes stop_codon:yes gene_type:complete